MKRLALVVFACACAHSSAPARPVPLASVTSHARTVEERKADVCAREDLVQLEGPLVTGSAQAPEHGVVKSVGVRDTASHDVDVPPEALRALPHNATLDMNQAREVARRLWATGRFEDVAIETAREGTGDGLAVTFRVTPKRGISRVFTTTSDAADDIGSLHLLEGNPYDPVALVSARRGLVDSLKKRGHLDASVLVSSAFADADRRAIDVCVRVDRGPRVTLDKIDVRGSANGAALASVLATDDTTNVHGAVLDEIVLERDVLLLSPWLYDHGYITSHVEKKIERHGDTLTAVLDVTDGPVYRYSSIDVKGDLAAPKAEYMKIIGAKPGDVFDRSSMIKVIDGFKALDRTAGHDAIEIDPESQLDATKHTVALVFSLHDNGKFSAVDLARGSGARTASKGDTVSVNYKGMLTDGTVFDTNKGHGTFDFTLGGGQVIQGFDRGVAGMKIGGKRRVTIPPDMGYGARGAPPKIPSNAVLVFEIELVAIR